MAASASAVPYFQRAWQISAVTPTGQQLILSSSTMDVPLRAVFTVNKTIGLTSYWDADVVLYNTNDQTNGVFSATDWNFHRPLDLGVGVAISAGYKNSNTGPFDSASNEIYAGSLFQPLWTRENVTDWKLTLRCLVGLFEDAYNYVNFTLPAGVKPYNVVQQLCTECGLPAGAIDQTALSSQTFSRAQTIFGRPFERFRQVAKDNDLSVWLEQYKDQNGNPAYKVNLRSLEFNPNITPSYTYAPANFPIQNLPQGTQTGVLKRTLIGTPEQTQFGVTFKVLLDAQPKLAEVVQLAPGTSISRLPYTPPNYPGILDQRGLYIVSGIKHYGDTRGGDESWYTEITGLTYQFPNIINVTGTVAAPNTQG